MNELISTERRSSTSSGSTEPPERAAILWVDDPPARFLAYEALLADLPIRCVLARSEEEVRERLVQHEFAAIVLNVSMAATDGFELARSIRGRPGLERTPILLMTMGGMSAPEQLAGYEIGALDYLHLPVVPDVLRTKVSLLIELSRRRDALRRFNGAVAEAQRRDLESARPVESPVAWRALFDHPDQMAVILDTERDPLGAIEDLIYRDANRNAERLLGRTRQQLVVGA